MRLDLESTRQKWGGRQNMRLGKKKCIGYLLLHINTTTNLSVLSGLKQYTFTFLTLSIGQEFQVQLCKGAIKVTDRAGILSESTTGEESTPKLTVVGWIQVLAGC